MSILNLSNDHEEAATSQPELQALAEELRTRIERYELLAAGTSDAIWDWDVQSHRVFYSPRWKELRGLAADAVSDDESEWVSRIHPEDLPRVMTAVEAHFEGKTDVFCEEYRVQCKDGSWIWILDRGIAVRNEQGQVTRMAGSESDITARKRMEAVLRQREQRLRWALQAAGGGAWEWDLRSGLAWWSNEMYALWGVEPGTPMRLEGSLDVIDPRDRESVRATVEEAIAGQGDYHCEFRIRHPACGVRWMASDGRVICGDDGEAVALLGLTLDITERKDAVIALGASEAHLRQLADAMPQLVWTGRADGTLDYYNSRVQEYAGIERMADGTWSWQLVLHPDDREPTVAAWQHAVATGEVYQFEHRIRMADGSLRWHLSRAVPIADESGTVLKWFGTATDIDEVKRAQEVLQEADRCKNDFLATLSHELRNPLAPIRNAVEILKARRPTDSTERAALDIIDRQLGHMTRLVDDLLDVGRISRGDLPLSREPVALGAILDQALEAARPHVEHAGHELVVSLPERPVMLDADPVRLAQVFSNLLNNACKYTPRGGTIRLSAELEADEVLVRVTDNGIGIEAEDVPRLFEMFSQLGERTGEGQIGLGVGLSLARSLVQMHGGRIEISSEGHGKGSELVVRLPTHPESAVAGRTAEPAREEDRRPRSSSLRVLLADDSKDIVDSLAMLLSLNGYRVEKAYDGLEAVAAAERCRADVILLDIGMPGLDGYHACERIRQSPGGADARIFALTGWGQDDDRRMAAAAGFDDLLIKPVDPTALMRLLARADACH